MDIISYYSWVASILIGFYAFSEYLPLLVLFLSKPKPQEIPYKPITVIIPTKNEESVIEASLNAWVSIDYPQPIEILVVDSSNNDKTDEVIKQNFSQDKRIKIIKAPHLNKLQAMIFALPQSNYNYIVLSDADRVPHKESLKKLFPFLSEDTGAVFGMGRIVQNDTLFQKIASIEFMSSMIDVAFSSRLDSNAYLYTNTCIIKKDLISDLSSPALIADDIYLALNIRKKGLRIKFIPEVYSSDEQVIRKEDIIKKRMRTSQGTIELGKSNYLNMSFNPKYRLFGLVVLPFRQISTYIVNIGSFLFVIGTVISAFFIPILLISFLLFLISIYSIILSSITLRYIFSNLLFPERPKNLNLISFLMCPLSIIGIRKVLTGFVFLSYFVGMRYRWLKSHSDRKEI